MRISQTPASAGGQEADDGQRRVAEQLRRRSRPASAWPPRRSGRRGPGPMVRRLASFWMPRISSARRWRGRSSVDLPSARASMTLLTRPGSFSTNSLASIAAASRLRRRDALEHLAPHDLARRGAGWRRWGRSRGRARAATWSRLSRALPSIGELGGQAAARSRRRCASARRPSARRRARPTVTRLVLLRPARRSRCSNGAAVEVLERAAQPGHGRRPPRSPSPSLTASRSLTSASCSSGG